MMMGNGGNTWSTTSHHWLRKLLNSRVNSNLLQNLYLNSISISHIFDLHKELKKIKIKKSICSRI